MTQIDKRSKEYRYIRRMRADLTAHIGGEPTFVQKLVIDRLSLLSLKLYLLDRKLLAGTFTEFDQKTYLAWSNSFIRGLNVLGIQPVTSSKIDPIEALRDYIVQRGEAA